MLMTQSVALFLIAGLFEIGGGYLAVLRETLCRVARIRQPDGARDAIKPGRDETKGSGAGGGPASFRLAARCRSDIRSENHSRVAHPNGMYRGRLRVPLHERPLAHPSAYRQMTSRHKLRSEVVRDNAFRSYSRKAGSPAHIPLATANI